MRTLFTIVLSLVAASLLPTSLRAGGWTQEEEKGYYKIDLRVLRAGANYDSTGEKRSIATYSDYTIGFYGEYGISNGLTAIVAIPFYKRVTINRQVGQPSGLEITPGASGSGIGDVEMGLRFGIAQEGPTVLAAAIQFGLPLGDPNLAPGISTGDGEFNQIVSLQAGHSFYPLPMYAAADIGLNNRSKGFADQVMYGGEVGYSFGTTATLIARARGVASLGNGSASIGSPGLFSNNQRYLSFGTEALYMATSDVGISVGVESATLARNTLSAPTFSIGIFYKP